MQHLTEETFEGTWPYRPNWFETADGRVHYVDEGSRDGIPVVLVHGNPAWGYLYRNFIPPLVEAGHRVIVPDLLGAGRSEKPDRPEVYRIRRHAERTEQLLEALDLRDATLVPHDWGMHSLYWAIRHPERVRSLFILNTIAHRRREEIELPLPIRLFRSRVTGDLLVRRLDLVRRFFLFKFGIVHSERVTPELEAGLPRAQPDRGKPHRGADVPARDPDGPERSHLGVLGRARGRARAPLPGQAGRHRVGDARPRLHA